MAIHPAVLWSIGAVFAGAAAAVAVDFAGVRTALQESLASEFAEPTALPEQPTQVAGDAPSDHGEDGRAAAQTAAGSDSDPSSPAAASEAASGDETVQMALSVDPEEPPTLTDGAPQAVSSSGGASTMRPDVPRFDLLRAEPDGSLVIAGTGPANASMEIVAGTRTVAQARAEANGDFVAVLDEPLDPGDYQIVLRATTPDGAAVTSRETAVVAIPEEGSSDVLALVEEPGAPSRLITTPGPETPVLTPVPAAEDGPATDDEGVSAAQAGEAVASLPADQGAGDGNAAAEPAADAGRQAATQPPAAEEGTPPATPGGSGQATDALAAPETAPTDEGSAPADQDAVAGAGATDAAPREPENPSEAGADAMARGPVDANGARIAPEGATGTRSADADGASSSGAGRQLAALPDTGRAEPSAAPAQAGSDVDAPGELRIEAVEIDGSDLFVAGAATPGTRLRLYANAILLGDTIASQGGRFLVQVRRDLPVGDYIIRADAIDPATGQVLRRASVPFTRSAGERLAAVAVAPSARLPRTPPTVPFAELDPAPAPPSAQQPAGGEADAAAAQAEPNDAAAVTAETETSARATDSAEPDGDARAGTTSPAENGEDDPALAAASAADSASTEPSAASGTSSAAPTPSQTARAPVPQALGVLQGPPPIADAVPQTTSELVPTGESVIIRRGDTLWQISRRVYGQGVKYTTIYLANQQQISDPDRIWPGQIFDVPGKAMEDAETVHRQLRTGN